MTKPRKRLLPIRSLPTYGPSMTLDTRRSRDQEDPDDDVLEIHNHMPGGEEHSVSGENIAPHQHEQDDDEDPEVVARYPAASHHVVTDESGNIVVRRGSPQEEESDRHSTAPARDARTRPPRSLSELNRFNATYYARRKGAR